MGGVWRCVVFTLLLATVGGAWPPKKKSTSNSATSQQANSVKEMIKEEESTLAEGEYTTKRTGKSGDSLIIGSYSHPLHNSYSTPDHYGCELVNNVENIYKKEYEPEIYKRTSDSYEMTQAEEKQPQAVAENFMHFKMEIWKCTKSGTEASATYAMFYFIRNEFISVKDIRDIKHVSGVEVSLIDYASDERRVKVVETKYFYPTNHRHQGETFEKASGLNFKLQLKVHEPQNPFPKPGLAFEVKYSNEQNNLFSFEIDSSGDGANLLLGPYLNMAASQIPTTAITAQCEPQQGINPALRRPEVFKIFQQSSQSSASNEDRSIHAKLSDKQFDDLFIITKRKFWKCTPNGKGTSTSEHNSFYRVIHEVVGIKPITKVIRGFGIEEIVSVQMPDRQANTVRFTIVDNFYMHDLSRITNPVSLTYKEERLTATIKSPSDAKEIIDVDFRLTKRAAVFRTLIGDEGYDLRVGSEQKLQYNSKSAVTCTKTNYTDKYETNFKIIMKNGDKFHRTSDVLDEANKYYKYLSKNAWKCTGNTKNSQTLIFLRVVNELQVLVKVNEIETFDGVEIFYDGSDVKLVETKYYVIYPEGIHSIKFDFKIELKEEGAETDSGRAENSPAEIHGPKKQLVRKTNDEIVTWVDHHSNTKHALKFKGDPRTESLKLLGTGQDHIHFTYKTRLTTGEETATAIQKNIYICEPKENPKHKPMAVYDVYGKDDSRVPIYTQEDLGNNEYFTDVDIEVQVCDQMIYNQESNTDGEVKQIYRVVSEQTLKDEKVTAISTVTYDQVLRDVGWFETGSDDNRYKLKLKTFRYYNYSQSSKPSLHSVSDDETLLMKPVTQPIAGWKSGSMAVENIDQKREEILMPTRINYLERLHETEIPEFPTSGIVQIKKESLIIGSKWTKVFESYAMEMNCNFQDVDTPNKIYETEMKTRNGSSVRNDDYLQNWYQEVWECTPDTGSTASDTADKMYRIVNEYSIKSDKLIKLNVLYNYDGVTIHRTKPITSATENILDKILILVKEIKYIHKGSIVKFEGVIKLIKPNPAGTEHVTKLALPHSPHRSRNSYRRDIMLPKKNVVFQTVIVNNNSPGQTKRIYEFGENSQIEIQQGELPYVKCTFKTDTVKEGGKTEIDWKLMTKVSLYRALKEGGGTDRLTYDITRTDDTTLSNRLALFDFSQRIWTCERQISGKTYEYRRVQNEFGIASFGGANNENVLIYHYEGVTVARNGQVREVKYYDALGESIRYDGVVWLDEPNHEQANDHVKSILNELHLDDKSGREVYYYLDKPMLEFKSVNEDGKGRPVQFGEPAESDRTLEVVQPIPGKPVTCKTYSGDRGDIRTQTATKCFTTHESRDETANKFSRWIKIILGMEDTRAYTYRYRSNIWECKREEDEQLFLRVENIYVPSYRLYPMYRLFVADGLTLKTIKLPDKTEHFLITEVKYFKQERNEKNELSLVPVKFDGEVILVVEEPSTIMKRLYPSTSDYELAGSDTNGKYWSMDALKTQLMKIKTVYAIEEIVKDDRTDKNGKKGNAVRKSIEAADGKKSPTKTTSRRNSMARSVAAVKKGVTTAVTGSRTETGRKELPPVIYKEKGKVYAIALGGRGRRIFHIAGDDWTEDADKQGYSCIQDIWSPKDRLRFIPKVIERIDDFNYELNGEALLKLFKIEQEVHLCIVQNSMSRSPVLTRVTTTLETDAYGINAVSYSGSARVDIVKRDEKKNAESVIKITIDTFIEEVSSAISKSDTHNTQYETTIPQNILTKLKKRILG